MDKDEASTTQIPQDRILKVEIDRNSAEWIS
jgi:probable phosphoglycerate mutase